MNPKIKHHEIDNMYNTLMAKIEGQMKTIQIKYLTTMTMTTEHDFGSCYAARPQQTNFADCDFAADAAIEADVAAVVVDAVCHPSATFPAENFRSNWKPVRSVRNICSNLCHACCRPGSKMRNR